MLLLHDKDQR